MQSHYAVVENDPPKKHGRPSNIAYEDIRIRPRSALTIALMNDTVEHFLEIDQEGVERSSRALVTQNQEDNIILAEAPEPANHQNISQPRETESDTINRVIEDIGPIASEVISNPVLENEQTLSSAEQQVLADIKEVIGKKQVSGCEMEFAPPWTVNQAVEREVCENWTEAYEPIHRNQMPRDANIISSHFVYKVKTDEKGLKKFKARLVIHGNRDDDKDIVRKDAVAANLFITRLLLSVGTILHLKFEVADIKGEFMQSGPITLDIYVKPPKSLQQHRQIYWKLKKLPY